MGKPLEVRFCTYNILAQGDESDYSTREDHLFTKLENQCSKCSIICLQEVTVDSSERLNQFFSERNYGFIHSSRKGYGREKRGEGIAYPKKCFEIKYGKRVRVSEYIKWDKRYQNCPDNDMFCRAKDYRDHYMVFGRLKILETGLYFCVGACHLIAPVKNKPREMRFLHSCTVLQAFQDYRGSEEGVLMGDFNSEPDGEASIFKLLTEGNMKPSDHPDYPITRLGEYDSKLWLNLPFKKMKSVYPYPDGNSKDRFTQITSKKCPNGRNSRKENAGRALDYIFYTPGWKLINADKLPKKVPQCAGRSFTWEPSDHLLIGAKLELKFPCERSTKGRRYETSQASIKRCYKCGSPDHDRKRCNFPS